MEQETSFKNLIEEFSKMQNLPLPTYKVAKLGPDHNPTFTALILAGNTIYAGHNMLSMIEAEESAAKMAAVDLEVTDEAKMLKGLLKEKQALMDKKKALRDQSSRLIEEYCNNIDEKVALRKENMNLKLEVDRLAERLEVVDEN